MKRILLVALALLAGVAIGSTTAEAQCNPVYNTTSSLPACTARQQLPITVPAGQSIEIQSGASLTCDPGSSCIGSTVVPSNIPYTQAGTGAVPQTLTNRLAQYLSDQEFLNQSDALTQAVATNAPLLQAPSINVGFKCGYFAVSSGTYNNATGAVSLTIAVATNYVVASAITVSGLVGTGSISSLNGNFTTTTGTSGTTINYTAASGLGAITITAGGTVTPPNLACDGMSVDGFVLGHSAIGNNTTGTDAFVGLWADETYTNANQEMRGISYTVRNNRTTADEPTLGWDVFPVLGSLVVPSTNTQNIIGNMKSVVAESHFFAPATGSYSVRNAFNLQASLVDLGANVTLTNWQGLIVSATPTGGGTITTGYGVEIGAITATTPAAIKLDGPGTAGRILWTGADLRSTASGALGQFSGSTQVWNALLNSTTSTLSVGAGTTGVNFAEIDLNFGTNSGSNNLSGAIIAKRNGTSVGQLQWNDGGHTILDMSGTDFLIRNAFGGSTVFGVTSTGVLSVNGTNGVTCTGSPTSSFASVNGLVTHC